MKLILLLAYSASLFFLESWGGLALAALALAFAVAASRLPLRPLLAPLVPVYFIVAITVALNAFSFSDGAMQFTMASLGRGLMMGVRILLLAWASLLVSYTTASSQMMSAFASFLHPLRALGVPTDDIALTLSLALRFIPLIMEELETVKRAQLSRGAPFEGGLIKSLKAWTGVFIPMFVGMFRRADRLSLAMESRCYGAPATRTQLCQRPFSLQDGVIVALGAAACVGACWLL